MQYQLLLSTIEGGTRTPMLVTGGLLPKSMHGKSLEGPIHIIDWCVDVCTMRPFMRSPTVYPAARYQTFANLAGVDTSSLPPGPAPLESQDMYGVLGCSSSSLLVYFTLKD
jgi:hypothetical protein